MKEKRILDYVKEHYSEVISDNVMTEYNLYLKNNVFQNEYEFFSISVYHYNDENKSDELLIKSFEGENDNIDYHPFNSLDSHILIKILLNALPFEFVFSDIEILYNFVKNASTPFCKGRYLPLDKELEISIGAKETIYISQIRIYNDKPNTIFVYGYSVSAENEFNWDFIDNDIREEILRHIKYVYNCALSFK